jgi:hypothetical protein
MVRPKLNPATFTEVREPPRALIVASDSARFAAAVVSLGCDIDRAFRATSVEQARAKQREWAARGKASVILAIDCLEGVETDDPADEGAEALGKAEAA